MKPILFNTEMVRAILDGCKSVTRRAVKPQPPAGVKDLYQKGESNCWRSPGDTVWFEIGAPYQSGDILYVRETFALVPDENHDPLYRCCFKADNENVLVERWHPSIHMLKEDARIFLRVTDVRVERLQDISEEQARAEGASPLMVSVDHVDTPDNERTWHEWGPALPGFIDLWDSTVKKADLPRYGWYANPWVWVIAFKRISKEAALKMEVSVGRG